MAIELVCSCGNVFQVDELPADRQVRCPACQAIVPATCDDDRAGNKLEAGTGRKPLWALMGRAAASAEGGGPPATAPQRPEDAADSSTAAAPAGSESATNAPARKGLWGVMQTAAPPLPATPPLPQASPIAPASETNEPATDPQTAADPALAALLEISANDALESAQGKAEFASARNSRRAMLSLALGIASIPISFLALINAIWSRLPAPVVGFLAVLTGLLAAQEIQRSAGRKTGRRYAISGVVAGLLGSFLGPVVVSGLGRRLIEGSQRGFTTRNLKTIATALSEYEKQRGSFPPGGVFQKNKAGDLQGYHGWLTKLLPWVGEGDLYAAIDQNVPYDDAKNFPVFSQDIPVFFAAGTDRSKVRGRFGAAHFAGVGGEIVDDSAEEKRTLHSGLFGTNSHVTRDDVTDGLSNTLAAGEIAADLPAWGDPENWRAIGQGLNRDRQGFGNFDRSGACFLMADGSVRFFSNKTSLRVLTSLSTRDGGEP